MRVFIDIRLLTKGGRTGIPGYTRELTDTLIKLYPQHQFTLFYNGWSRQPLPDSWRSAPNVRILERGIPNRLLDIYFRFAGSKLFSQGQDRPDVIFSPHFNVLPKTNIPRVITFHDVSFIHYPQFFSLKQRLWHRWQNYAKQAHEASHLIAVSEYTKADLIKFLHMPPEKISVIYSGISPEFEKLRGDSLELRGFKAEKKLERPFFLFLGTLEPRKNIPTLIKAFALLKANPRFKEHELVIAGRPGYKADEIYKAAIGVDGVRFIENVQDEDRAALYSAARAFVFPSWFEGFGFPPLEAQACGTPVIAADRTSLPEILGDSALYCDPWKPSSIAEAMANIEIDATLRHRIISAGLENAKNFSWHHAASDIMEVWQNVLK